MAARDDVGCCFVVDGDGLLDVCQSAPPRLPMREKHPPRRVRARLESGPRADWPIAARRHDKHVAVTDLAQAERDLRRARRDRDELVARRRALLAAARDQGIEPYKLARVLGLSRARLHQLLAAAEDQAVGAESRPLAVARKVHAALEKAEAELLTAELVRRRRVRTANREFEMGLGAIAAILDTTRRRVQQLRDQADAELRRERDQAMS